MLSIDVGNINCMVSVFVSALADAVSLRSRLRVSVHLVCFRRDNWIVPRYREFRWTKSSIYFSMELLLSTSNPCFLLDLCYFLGLIGYDHILCLKHTIPLGSLSSVKSTWRSHISWCRRLERCICPSTTSGDKALPSVLSKAFALLISLCTVRVKSFTFKPSLCFNQCTLEILEISWYRIHFSIWYFFDWINCWRWLLIQFTDFYDIRFNACFSLLSAMFTNAWRLWSVLSCLII